MVSAVARRRWAAAAAGLLFTWRRLARAGRRVVVDIPELRIIDDKLWQAVSTRQVTTTSKVEGSPRRAVWDRRRPRYLLSGLMRCGVCGGGFAKISLHHFGCSTARNKGTCTNLLTIPRGTCSMPCGGG